jgi:hypothetical protein
MLKYYSIRDRCLIFVSSLYFVVIYCFFSGNKRFNLGVCIRVIQLHIAMCLTCFY